MGAQVCTFLSRAHLSTYARVRHARALTQQEAGHGRMIATDWLPR